MVNATIKKLDGREARDRLLTFLLLLPAVGLMLTLYAYPFAGSIVRSFLDSDGAWTLNNYLKVQDLYVRDIVFTLAVSLLSTVLATIISILLSSYLRLSSGGLASRIAGLIYRLPIFVPFVVVAQMMTTFLAPHGLLNIALSQLGLINIDAPLQLLDWKGLTFGFVWKQAAFMTLIVASGFMVIDDSYIEAARSVGAGTPQVIWRILIPMSRASISVALVLAFTSTVGTFTLPFMLIGGKSPTTITVDIAHRVTYFGDWGVANALGTVSYVLVLVAAIYYLRYNLKQGVYETQDG
ncbi:MAG: ABC transporter permease subunit [Chloroflexota bacterium]|nr:ABC transporter permease subunit [Chloroflexota bacterium]